jgi:PAS domain S-box-containing protein
VEQAFAALDPLLTDVPLYVDEDATFALPPDVTQRVLRDGLRAVAGVAATCSLPGGGQTRASIQLGDSQARCRDLDLDQVLLRFARLVCTHAAVSIGAQQTAPAAAPLVPQCAQDEGGHELLRQQAETAQRQFRLIFESAPSPCLVLTPERFQIVAVSDAYLAATMVTRDQIMGRDVFDVFPDDPADPQATGVAALSASLQRVRQTRATDVMAVQRYPIRRPASLGGGFTLRYWSPINSPVLNSDGSIAFIIHRVEDVTEYVVARQPARAAGPLVDGARQEAEIVLRSLELKRLAQSLAESELRFQYVTRATKDVVWDWDIRSGALWRSQGGQAPLDAALAEVSALDDWSQRIHRADRTRVLGTLHASVAARKEHWSAEYRLCARDGAVRDVLHRSFLILDEHGRPSRMVGSITDLTERKRQEAKLREQAELLDYATDAILVRDLNNRVLYWNKAAVARYGWTDDEIIGKPVSETLYSGYPAEEFDRAMQALLRFGDFTGRMVHSMRDGRRFAVYSHWILVRHQDGSPRAILSVATDISERLELEQRLVQAQKLEALGRLTGGITHDFNNWLTVIIGNAEELVDALGDEPDLAKLALMIQMAGERAAGLTRRLLAFARRQPLTPQTLDARAVIESISPLIERSLHKNIDLQLRLATDSWLVYVDRLQLEASILNLCINARDAMPDGGALTIEVQNQHVEPVHCSGHEPLVPGEYVVVTVSDTGRGIPHELLEQVFEPFFTTKGEAGSGLGLSMVYGFAKQSNGNVAIDSEPGRGTIVRLYLPRSYQRPAPPCAPGATPSAQRMPYPAGGR